MSRSGRPVPRADDDLSPAARSVRTAGEVLLLGMVAAAPWPFACVDAGDEFLLSLAVLLLAALWAVHAALTGRLSFRPDVVSVALAGLALWTAAQLVPLPEGVVAVLSPARAEWHRTLLPAAEETLPGDAGPPAVRAAVVPLSVNPAATRALLARLLGVLIVYAAARNWLADRHSLRRLLWTLLGTGVALAAFALLQSATSPGGTGYWSVPLPETPFGPFVCRNHYPDYAALCAAGGLGLLLGRPGEDGGDWLTGRRVGLVLAVGFVLLTVPVSLSRGGTLAAAVAGLAVGLVARERPPRGAAEWGRLALLAAGGLSAAAGVVLGTASVQDRLATLGERQAVLEAGRLPMWRDVARLVPRFPLAGTGGGTFEAVEPTVRTDPQAARFNYEFAHNEYLEAQVEGGLVRLGLTALLAGGLLWTVGRGATARRERSVGGPLLGLWFGLLVVVLHAAGEFAVHAPAVAVAVAVAAGYAVAAATDGAFVPARVKVRMRPSRDGRSTLTEVVGEEPVAAAADRRLVARGPLAGAAGLAVVMTAGLVAADARTRARAAAYEQAAVAAANGYLPTGDPTADRVRYADARAAVRPDDPNGRVLAAEAHLQAAYERTLTVVSAGVGGVGWAGRHEHVEDGPDVQAAVRHLQAARRASPVAAKAHARLGLLAGHFRGEPAAVHFDRAKRLLPGDPEVWYAAGREAHRRGDRAAAFADWKRGLGLSTTRLADVLAAVKDRPAAELRDALLPPLAHVSLAAADALFPDKLRQADDRRPFLEAAVKQAEDARGPTATDWAAAATAADELGQPEVAGAAWQAAVLAGYRDVRIRDGYARWLEQEERYDEAVDQLRQLQKLTTHPSLQDRIEGCFHAQKLLRAMGG